MISYPETIPNGYTNQASGTIRGREIVHSPNMKQSNLRYIQRTPPLIKDEVPMLGDYIPSWATVDPSRQGVFHAGFYDGEKENGTGAWSDLVVTYVFGSSPVGQVGLPERNTNLSIVNYLAHHIARDGFGNSFYLESKFRSDIHTAECQFVRAVGVNISDDRNYSAADGGFYQNAAESISSVSLPLFFSFVSSCVGSYILVL